VAQLTTETNATSITCQCHVHRIPLRTWRFTTPGDNRSLKEQRVLGQIIGAQYNSCYWYVNCFLQTHTTLHWTTESFITTWLTSGNVA